MLKFRKGHHFLHAGGKAGDNDFTAVHLQPCQHVEPGEFFFTLKGEHVNGKKIQRGVM